MVECDFCEATYEIKFEPTIRAIIRQTIKNSNDDIDLEQDISRIDMSRMVEKAINKAFDGCNDSNVGEYEDKCNSEILEYYRALKRGEKWALDKQKRMYAEMEEYLDSKEVEELFNVLNQEE